MRKSVIDKHSSAKNLTLTMDKSLFAVKTQASLLRVTILLLVFLVFLGCKQKEVMLPVIHTDGIPETQNHSSLWIFFELNSSDTLAVLNKNNKLLNTNWIYHIDRRLTMKQIIPHLVALQSNRNKPSVHKKEGMTNFYSFADSKNKRISLVPYLKTNYVPVDGDPAQLNIGYKDETSLPGDFSPCIIQVQIANDSAMVDGKAISWDQINQIVREHSECKDQGVPMIRLAYSENLSYQEYLTAKAYLSSAQILVDQQEDVYSLK